MGDDGNRGQTLRRAAAWLERLAEEFIAAEDQEQEGPIVAAWARRIDTEFATDEDGDEVERLVAWRLQRLVWELHHRRIYPVPRREASFLGFAAQEQLTPSLPSKRPKPKIVKRPRRERPLASTPRCKLTGNAKGK